MYIREKKILLCFSILCLLAIGVFVQKKAERYPIQYSYLDDSGRMKLVNKMKLNEQMELSLSFNGESLPFDSEKKVFYLPLSMEKEWESGAFAAQSRSLAAQIFFLEDFGKEDKKELICQNHAIPFLAVSDGCCGSFFLKFTGVPVMEFKGTEQTTAEGLPVFSMALFDYAKHSGWVKRCFAGSALHGNTSLTYPKKSLRLKLLEQTEEGFSKHNADLLGIREDDDWILNSLYADESRVRDKLCMDLWQELGANSNPFGKNFGVSGEFVEVFINDSYQGLYLLTHPIDRKQTGMQAVSAQLAAGETQIERIYKKKYTASWQEADFVGESPDPNSLNYRGGFYLKGDTILGNETEWEPLRKLAACIEGEDDAFRAGITKISDRQNIIENWLFYQAIAGFDNQAKNMYYVVRKQQGGLKGYFIPWDLNISFGVVYAENDYYCEEDPSTVRQKVEWEPGNRLIKLDVDHSRALAKETWEKWRSGVLSEENLQKRIEGLERFVKDSGAFAREKERFPEGNCREDFSMLYDYAKKRLQFVDELTE
ncbi:MAG: hypothetical protein E7294_03465 [Lachnospiraceae bacterium]|jgi:hypothetical protein|nr:hypothetical protein [Lachnospiraceae bacterium]